MKIVISQPMLFPWVGMFEQIRQADVYVHYSDVQFSKGSFVNRVQIKTSHGVKWLTVPLEGLRFGQRIDEVKVNSHVDWRRQHLRMLSDAYTCAPFRRQMLDLVEAVYDRECVSIDRLSEASIMAASRYFGLETDRRFVHIQDLGVAGVSSQRVLDVVLALGGNVYVTGHGARHYLNHQLFEGSRVRVEYMNYRKLAYPQLHGGFTPYVSILDLIANVGQDGTRNIVSETVYWKDIVNNG